MSSSGPPICAFLALDETRHGLDRDRITVNTEAAYQGRRCECHGKNDGETVALVRIGDVQLDDRRLDHVEGVRGSRRRSVNAAGLMMMPSPR